MQRDPLFVRTDFGPGRIAGSIWALVSGLCFAILYVAAHQQTPIPIWYMAPFLVAASIAAGYGGRWFSRRHRQKEQRKRDIRAQRILETAHVHKAPDFSLFLRAFETTGRMPGMQTETTLAVGFDPRMNEDQTADFEKLLAQAVEKHIPLVALGRPGEQIGAGRILVAEEQWKEGVEALANASLVIFLFPSIRPGTLWEIDWVIQHALLKKTIFVMPPHSSGTYAYDWHDVWAKLAPAMSDKGIQFPEYDKQGQFFALGNDLRISTWTKLRTTTDRTSVLGLRVDLNKQLKAMAKPATST